MLGQGPAWLWPLLAAPFAGSFMGVLIQRLPALSEHATATTVVLSERKRDIAAQLGITPETLSRLLRSLTRKGLIEVVGYNVHVLDLPALRRLAGV